MARAGNLLLLPMTLFFDASTAAHHAFAPDYDGKRTITVEGVVREFQFIDPHAKLLVDIAGRDGKTVRWTFELAGRFNLDKAGWTAQTVSSGEQVTVTGHPTHKTSTRAAYVRLVKADGTELPHGFLKPRPK